jgi:hypothetical protein
LLVCSGNSGCTIIRQAPSKRQQNRARTGEKERIFALDGKFTQL